MSCFIDVLASWGPIDEEMIKCKKYCQFKAVDIFKALKKGEVPRRGGPKEQQNDETKRNESEFQQKSLGEPPLFDNKENSNEFHKVNIPDKQPNKDGEIK